MKSNSEKIKEITSAITNMLVQERVTVKEAEAILENVMYAIERRPVL